MKTCWPWLWLAFSPLFSYADTDPLNLSLEELMQIVVTSPAKKSQTIAETAAAISVITAEDIRRSGAKSLPEVLRLAPSVQVAALGNNQWAVSIRGQADRYSNKLLVLVDGRSVYTPFFSGVIWEDLAVPLANIERIEVLRGPGASLWGSNAVHGVINITTRSALNPPGSLVEAQWGSELRQGLLARHTWQLSPDSAAQVHLHAQHTGPSVTPTGASGEDAWRQASVGFRFDRATPAANWHLQGGLHQAQADDILFISPPPTFNNQLAFSTQQTEGGYLLGRWENQQDIAHKHSLQAYLEHTRYTHLPLTERRSTLDIEYQAQDTLSPKHQRIWGLNYRQHHESIRDPVILTFADPDSDFGLWAAYLQDEWRLTPETWRLMLGARLEYHDDIGTHIQPNIRLLWTPNPNTSLWASLARANRTPSRVERDSVLYVPFAANGSFELMNHSNQIEIMDALDLGWRQQLSRQLNLDLAAFYYRYDQLRNAVFLNQTVLPSGYLLIQTENRNNSGGHAYGVELAWDWRPASAWRVQATYSWLRAIADTAPGALDSSYTDTTPQHQASLRLSHDFSPTLQGDAWLRYSGDVPLYAIPAYTSLDLRIAWRPRIGVELGMVGQHLLDTQHPEYASNFLLSIPRELERGIYAYVRWELD